MTRSESDRPSLRGRWESQSTLKRVAKGIVAAVAAVFAAWVSAVFPGELFNLHTAIWTFLVVWAGLVGYFIYLRIPSNVLGVGCYIIGLSFILKPPVDFSNAVLHDGGTGFRATVAAIVSEFFTSSLLFAVLGFTVIGLGLLLRRRGRQQRKRKMRAMLRTEE